MGQLTLETLDYRYIIDTSSILSQKPNRNYRRTIYKKLWERIDQYIQSKVIVTCSEIFDEIQDKSISERLKNCNCVIISIDDLIQKNVIKIVNEHSNMIEFTGGKGGSSSGDAFLIATAMSYNLTVITEENSDKLNKIPQIFKSYDIDCVNLLELSEREGWEF